MKAKLTKFPSCFRSWEWRSKTVHAHCIIRLECMACNLGLQRMVNDITETMLGSLYVSGKLPTYPSPKPTLTLTSHFGQNVGLGEG